MEGTRKIVPWRWGDRDWETGNWRWRDSDWDMGTGRGRPGRQEPRDGDQETENWRWRPGMVPKKYTPEIRSFRGA